MSDIRARMKAVLREHECSYHWGGPDWDCAAEGCNASGGFWEEYAAHVADVLAEQLGLTQQWTWSWPSRLTGTGEPGYGYPCESAEIAREECADGPEYDIVTRWHTPWVRADGETGGAR